MSRGTSGSWAARSSTASSTAAAGLVTHAALRCDAGRLCGPEFAQVLAGPPRSAFLAEGSDIAVHRGGAIA